MTTVFLSLAPTGQCDRALALPRKFDRLSLPEAHRDGLGSERHQVEKR